MTLTTYQLNALRTWKTDTLTKNERILNATLGLNGEAGEVAELIKKAQFHGHDIDIDAVTKELGDVIYYAAVLAAEYELPLDHVMETNIEKLRRRYPVKFSAEASRNRSEL